MKFLAILFFGLASIFWYYFSWRYLGETMKEVLLNGNISSDNNHIIILIILAGMFVLGVLFGKLLAFSKIKYIQKTESDNYYIKDEETKTNYSENDFIPKVESIKSDEEISDNYYNYESDSEVTKDNIDIILDEREVQYKNNITKKENNFHNDFSHFEAIPDNTFSNVAQNLKKQQGQDLKIIEGIGPKIEQLLNEGGIFSYKDLYNSELSDIKIILENAGPRYAMHNPSTWGKQAKLANQGDFEGLSTYQESLIKGVEK